MLLAPLDKKKLNALSQSHAETLKHPTFSEGRTVGGEDRSLVVFALCWKSV